MKQINKSHIQSKRLASNIQRLSSKKFDAPIVKQNCEATFFHKEFHFFLRLFRVCGDSYDLKHQDSSQSGEFKSTSSSSGVNIEYDTFNLT